MGVEGTIKRSILLVDDDDIFREFIRTALVEVGFEVDSISTEEEATEKIAANKYFFYIFDLHIGEVNHSDPSAAKLIGTVQKYVSEIHRNSWIVLTSEDNTSSPGYKIISNIHAEQIRFKDELESVIAWIRECFDKFTPYNWSLNISDNLEEITLQLSDGDDLSGRDALAKIEELIRLLIKEESTIELTFLDRQGYGRTILFVAAPISRKPISSKWYVIKIGVIRK